MSDVILEIVSQHVEEAAFLWLLRSQAVHAPHYLLKDLRRLDDRVAAHLDGLRVNGPGAWEACQAAIAAEGAGAVFTCGVLAFECRLPERIDAVLQAAAAKPAFASAAIAALSWLPHEQAAPHIETFLTNPSPVVRRIGIAAACNHRRDPGQPLRDAFKSEDLALKARALRGAGEAGITALAGTLRPSLKDRDPACRFWAAWSLAVLSKSGEALQALLPFAQKAGPFTRPALQILMSTLDATPAQMVHTHLTQQPSSQREAVFAAGVLGLPEMVPWLIERMSQPTLARIAGAAFSHVTGAHIAYDGLEGDAPEGFEAGPSENPEDPNVAMDPDEHLAWPDPAKVQKWWTSRQKEFARGVRHLVGKPITPESLHHILRHGYQRQRIAAAIEQALRQPGQPLFAFKAPGWRQS